jgi:general secretion pathway protein D
MFNPMKILTGLLASSGEKSIIKMKDAEMKIFKFAFIGLVCVTMLLGEAHAEDRASREASFSEGGTGALAQAGDNKGEKIPGETPAGDADMNAGGKSASDVKKDTVTIYPGTAPDPPAADAQKEEDAPSIPQKPDDEITGSSSESPESAAIAGEEDAEAGSPLEEFAEASLENGTLAFNFDNAELAEVIRAIADLLHINYLIDPKVGGKVTIHTAGSLDRDELFPIFYQILEVNGLTALKQGNLYKIMPAKDAMRMPIPPKSGREGKKADPGEDIIIQIIPLNSISADEMSKILTSFVSSDGVIVAHTESNMLLVVDRADNISKILRLVNTFDANVFERVNYRFYPLQYGDVKSLSDIMNQMLVAYGSAFKTNMAFIPIERLNTLLVVGTNPNAFDEISDFVNNYDVPSQNAEPTLYVYPVKNGQAADIADLLNDIFQGKKEAKKDKKTSSSADRNPLGKTAKMEKKEKEYEASQSSQPAQPLASPAGNSEVSVGTGGLKSEVKITADEYRNSLIIQASPADYQVIKNLMVELDVLPRQVLIEATIAEITLDDKTELGVEWAYKKGEGSLTTSLLSANAGRNGLTFTIGDATQWTATMTALAAQNKVNILSSPSVLASNGLPASIDISTEIPVATSSYEYTSTEDPVFSSDIEYRDTGVMLTVTPHINELGLVTMDIDQEVSEQADNVQVGEQNYPSFFKRSAQTTLTVQSGQTIVIGGLIKETKTDGAAGIPWLVSVPVLNFLFGKTADTTSKTELIIMISPYVIAQLDEVEAVSMEFKSKLKMLFPESRETPVEVLQNKDRQK